MALDIILGPMFSGKTTELINRISTSTYRKLIIKHQSDLLRYNTTGLTAHSGVSYTTAAIYPMNKLEELFIHFHNIPLFDLNTIDEIYIDEAQFFTDLYECIHILIHHYRKHVIIAGLDGDYTGAPFINGQLLHLIPLATTVVKLHSICYICGGYAPFTKRISDYKGQILIGGAELYAPTCLLCR